MGNFIESAAIEARIGWCKWIMAGAAALACLCSILQFYAISSNWWWMLDTGSEICAYLLYLLNFSFGYLLFSNGLSKMRIAGIYMMSGVAFSFLYTLLEHIMPMVGLEGEAALMAWNGYLVLTRLIIPHLLEGMAIVILFTVPAFNKTSIMSILLIWLAQFGVMIVFAVKNIVCAEVADPQAYMIIGGINTIINVICNGTLIYMWWHVTTCESRTMEADCDGEYSMAMPWKNRVGIGYTISIGLLCVFAFIGCLIAKSVI